MRFSIEINNSDKFPSIELIDSKTNCSATIFCFGGLLNSFLIDVDGKTINIVDGYESVSDAIAQKNTWFKSCRLSPFVCRLKNGEFEFEKEKYKIEKFYLDKHAIHGLVYDAVYAIDQTEATEKFSLAELSYEYKGIDKGYPFQFYSKIIWKLEAGNMLSVNSIISHSNKNAIPYCEGWHPYFRLDTAIDNCSLQINANNKIEFDDEIIPTGKIIETNEFKDATLLKNKFLDDCYELSQNTNEPCVLSGKNIQLKIIPDNSYPYLQVFIPPDRKSIAIENLSAIPNAFNNKIGLKLLEPNKEFSFKTKYQIIEYIN